MKILAIDLGKYKSVACNYVTATGYGQVYHDRDARPGV